MSDFLDVISVNIWSIVISLCNLIILFLIIRHFLFKPVNKVLDERQSAIDTDYSNAKTALDNAKKTEDEWNAKITEADKCADGIIKEATEAADRRGDEIVAEAKKQADSIVDRARNEMELERRKSEEAIKKQIADVSVAVAGKLLSREISEEDHHKIIDSFIDEIGEENE